MPIAPNIPAVKDVFACAAILRIAGQHKAWE